MHVNTARAHVAALEDAGAIVSRLRERPGRGRQGIEYALQEGWSLAPEDFLAVAEILATAIIRAGTRSEKLLALGRDWGRYMVGRPGAHEPKAEVIRALNRFGHLAEIEGDQLHLAGCPCILVAPERPCIVCDLVMGVVDGVLEASGSNLRVGERRHVLAERRCNVVLTKGSDPRSSPKPRYLSAAAGQ